MKRIPKHYVELVHRYPQVVSAYENLAGQCHRAGPLNERERILVKLGVAVGSHTEGSVHSQVRKALEAGILGPDEIRHAVLMALTSIGFPRMMAALTWAEDILAGKGGRKRRPLERRQK